MTQQPPLLSRRDLSKHIGSVRMDAVYKNIQESVHQFAAIKGQGGAFSSVNIDVFIESSGLNMEEISLLRDSEPNARPVNGKLHCSWKFSRAFHENHKAEMRDIINRRIAQAAKQLHEARRQALEVGRLPYDLRLHGSLQPAGGFWDRVARSVGLKPKQSAQVYSNTSIDI